MDWEAGRSSFALAVVTAIVLIPFGILLARWLAFTQHRSKVIIEALTMLPLLLPPTVIDFYMLSVFGRGSPIGAWLDQVMGVQLVFTFEGFVFASMLINIPFMVQPLQRAFAAIPEDVREAAWVCGLSHWQTWWRVELPLAWPGLLAGIALTIAHTLGEFGVVLMVGGSIAGETKTLSIAIYDRVQSFDNAAAALMAVTLVAFSIVAIAVVLTTGAPSGRSREPSP
ncbi:MAG: molybdate ABC transporter permease subunit [Betaproteobacteria bacterium]|nr:molybdate ABC transporter permease subunit [Betaproteobacteria bacterium]